MRQYFYKEKDKIKKYTYCSLCSSGPFKEEDEGYDFLRLGSECTPVNYCKRCCYIRNYKLKERPIDFKSIEELSEKPDFILEKPKSNTKKSKSPKPVSGKIPEKLAEIENKSESIFFILVQCKDKSFYSSVSGLTLEKALRNMNIGKGPNYTKPIYRRPVNLLFYFKLSDKTTGDKIKKLFDSWNENYKKEYVDAILNSYDFIQIKEIDEMLGKTVLYKSYVQSQGD